MEDFAEDFCQNLYILLENCHSLKHLDVDVSIIDELIEQLYSAQCTINELYSITLNLPSELFGILQLVNSEIAQWRAKKHQYFLSPDTWMDGSSAELGGTRRPGKPKQLLPQDQVLYRRFSLTNIHVALYNI